MIDMMEHDGLIDVISKRREIINKYKQLPVLHQQILYAQYASPTTAYYFSHNIPIDDRERLKYQYIERVFGEISPTAVLVSNMDMDEMNNRCRIVPMPKDIVELKVQADRMHRAAVIAFYERLRKNEK